VIGIACAFFNADLTIPMHDVVNFLTCQKVSLGLLGPARNSQDSRQSKYRSRLEMVSAGYTFACCKGLRFYGGVVKVSRCIKNGRLPLPPRLLPKLLLQVEEFYHCNLKRFSGSIIFCVFAPLGVVGGRGKD
jgi:hypothetical protein